MSCCVKYERVRARLFSRMVSIVTCYRLLCNCSCRNGQDEVDNYLFMFVSIGNIMNSLLSFTLDLNIIYSEITDEIKKKKRVFVCIIRVQFWFYNVILELRWMNATSAAFFQFEHDMTWKVIKSKLGCIFLGNPIQSSCF
jgi:hypothetical protein